MSIFRLDMDSKIDMMNIVKNDGETFETLEEEEEVAYEMEEAEVEAEQIGVIYIPGEMFLSDTVEIGQDGEIVQFVTSHENDDNDHIYEEIICHICNQPMEAGMNMVRFPPFSQNRWAENFGIVNQPHEHYICAAHFTEYNPADIEKRTKAKYKHDGSHYHYRDAQPTENLKIFFRESNFRVKSTRRKAMHHVAVIPVPEDPNQYYEFSYNAKSKDGKTSFYSCLGCRKATADSKTKDRVRTIHLQGNRLLSRYHPLRGHHMACRPIVDETRAYLKNLIYTKCEPDDLPPRLSPQHMPEIPPLKKNADFSRKIENFDADAFGGFSDTYSNQIIMDELGNQYTLVPEQELPSTSKVQDIQEVYDISTDQEDHAYDSYKYPSLTQNIELEEIIGSPDPPRLKPYGVVDHENFDINSMSKSTNRVFRKRLKYGKKNKKELVPKCYICFRVLKNAEQLAHHLLNAHVNTKKSSSKSGSKCSRKPKREAQ